MSKKAVKVIPAKVARQAAEGFHALNKRKVAGYARVSTDHEEQQTSYEAQVDYYTNFIQNRDDWEFVTVYTDEGISATSTARRAGFNQMVADAMAGQIDLIVTKSVSRFARNTVDSLSTIRKLKEHGTEVYFEKENIWTFDGKGELLISIMSSLAQEESRSISQNVTWGHRKRFADGKVSLAYSRFLGYDKGENGTLVVNPEQAETVRLIYRLFLEGGTPHSIAKRLTELGLPSPGGKAHWVDGTVKSILTNEKYKGDALLQKQFTVDFLTKKQKVNEGEVPQYYIENNHEAIINPTVFDMVQQEFARRENNTARHSAAGLFSSRIKCADCGSWYGSKLWHSNSKYRRTVWQCNGKYAAKQKCQTPHFSEAELKSQFLEALNQVLANRNEVIRNLETMRKTLFDTTALEAEVSEQETEVAVVTELIQTIIAENSRVALNQTDYQNRYAALVARLDAAQARLDEVQNQITDKRARNQAVRVFIKELRGQDGLLTEFDERLWYALADHGVANRDGVVQFVFKDGSES